MKKKVILIATCIAAVSAVLLICGFSSGFGATKVRTVSAGRKSVSDSYTEDGTISLGESFKVVSEVSGPVREVEVSENQFVKKGTVLYSVGTDDYSYELEVLKAQLAGYEAQFEKAKVGNVMTLSPEEYLEDLRKQKESAAASLSAASSTYTAYTELFAAGDVAKTDYEGIRAEYENAEAAYQSASSRYSEAAKYLKELEEEGMSGEDIRKAFYNSDSDAIEASIEGTKAQIEELKTRIDKCTVVAREDGVISELPVKNLSVVSAGQETAEIKTRATPKVESDVLTAVAPYLHIGDDVDIKLSLRGKDEVYKGVISEIYDYAERGTSALGTDEYRVHVVMELQEPAEENEESRKGALGASSGNESVEEAFKGREGYGVNVTFSLYDARDVLTVPASSVFDSGDRDYVYTVEDGKAVKTEITVEYRTASDVVVKSGINVGDRIIERADDEGTYDGARVKG
ncbi:efflux RND transporter periplasmic adaptor subunit [Oribacterium sp. WCC10]|uniref:efflux RND transporter periplasmic adaptor subunit n=1 Tax=Oribacterium sp. WCC10 TaxID=1855343 RepID=UPI0008E926A5|nr:HlyD family efflux transporter periplasmic adaptor subunit [Oribacterium sp. WCC10]SFG05956.1 HlyD family secretion protein [Oribacterium sp. WCC10]